MNDSSTGKIVVKVLVDYDRWKYLTDRNENAPQTDNVAMNSEVNKDMISSDLGEVTSQHIKEGYLPVSSATTASQPSHETSQSATHEQILENNLVLDQQYVKKLNQERQLESMKKIKRPKQSFAARNKDSLDANFWYMGK